MTSLRAAVSPVGRLWSMSERRGQSRHADTDTSVNTSMPSCKRKHSGPEEGKLLILKYPFMGSALFSEAATKAIMSLRTNTKERNLLSLGKAKQSFSDYFWHIWYFWSALIYSHCQTTDPRPCLPEELQTQRQKLLMYLYLATRGKEGGEKTIVW